MRRDHHSFALACLVFAVLFGVMLWIGGAAHSQEAPSRPPCGPAADIHSMLQSQYGETVTAAGVIGAEFMELTTSKSGTFTILMRKADGTACIIAGGTGFALADRAKMKGPGL